MNRAAAVHASPAGPPRGAVPPASGLDIAANRRARKWRRGEILRRVLFALARPLFALSPRPLWGFRRALLRLYGARVGREVRVNPSVRLTMPWHLTLCDRAAVGERAILYALGPIEIGADATVSQGAHLCAGSHDIADPAMALVTAPIRIEAGAWICAEAFVGPGVTIGPLAVVGARAVAMADVAAATIVVGNPARVVGTRRLRDAAGAHAPAPPAPLAAPGPAGGGASAVAAAGDGAPARRSRERGRSE